MWFRRPRPAWPQTGLRVGQPPPTDDPSCQILCARIAKEELRQLCAAARGPAGDTYDSHPGSAPGTTASSAGAPTPTSPNVHRLAATIETWWPAFLRTGSIGRETKYGRKVHYESGKGLDN